MDVDIKTAVYIEIQTRDGKLTVFLDKIDFIYEPPPENKGVAMRHLVDSNVHLGEYDTYEESMEAYETIRDAVVKYEQAEVSK
jgi:hypothetical protein